MKQFQKITKSVFTELKYLYLALKDLHKNSLGRYDHIKLMSSIVVFNLAIEWQISIWQSGGFVLDEWKALFVAAVLGLRILRGNSVDKLASNVLEFPNGRSTENEKEEDA